ncbi:tetratricopeptide repeat protein [Amycolatopsis sp. CA-126428]|uniref:tetratricopeptide repeat protein n=1 Tax=Amycolatopsis sp. CA-126428 TaxID=2073158 RepID=UPI0011B09316|nr:tetratricopeptide repeat protein [Amycolatopsis sp. CA-126428]
MTFLLELGAASVEVTEFAGTDLPAVRELVERGEIVLLREEIPAPGSLDQWPRDVAESIGECAVVPLSSLTGAGGPRYPLVVGRRESIRFLCSYAESVPVPCEAQPVVTDYREFRHLWLGGSPAVDPDGFAIGITLAGLHARNVLHGDAHRGNWLFDRDGTALVHDPRPVFLHTRPSAEQCATDIRPLLPGLTPDGWQSFRLGYRRAWPEEGRVIDLIQLSDRTGWAAAFRTGEFARAGELAARQLTTEDTSIVRVMLLANRAMALSRTERHDEALQECLAALKLAKQRCPHVADGLGLTLAVVLSGQGRQAEAVDALRSVSGQPEQLLARLTRPDAQLPIMNL